ncbi:Uncharacterized protein C2orf55 [Cricetulus griseus]|uniref:Uncharacterized protein C2orf55 n=1 Tax=Cricetulus griseus TaxID=10029 RepID=G3I704_CRIGR|nr:Uncharacterized protein C2orf55 [Cricetulus griseus]
MISTRVMDIKLREAAEGLGEDGTGKKKSKFKTFKKLFGKKKRKESPSSTGNSTWKQSQAKSEVIAIESGPVGYDSEDELEESRSTLGNRALSHDSIFFPESGQDPARPVRVFSQENVCDRIKALQMKIQCNVKMGPPPPGGISTKRAEETGMSSEDDGLPRSPPEMSLLHDVGPGTTIKASAVCALEPHLPRAQSESLSDLSWTLEEEGYEAKHLFQFSIDENSSFGQRDLMLGRRPELGGPATLLLPGGACARRARLQHSTAVSASMEEGDEPSSHRAMPEAAEPMAVSEMETPSLPEGSPYHVPHREIQKEELSSGGLCPLVESTSEEVVCGSGDVETPLSDVPEGGMTPSKEDSTLHEGDTTFPAGDTTLREGETIPSKEGITPPEGDILLREAMAPPERDMSPSKGDIAPPKSIMVPPERDMSPPETDLSPSKGAVAPPKRIMEPPERDMSPSKGDIACPKSFMAPPERDLAPPVRDMSPSKGNVAPPERDMSPPETDLSPSKGNVAPPERDMSPPETDLSPSKGNVAPPERDMSPPETDLSPSKGNVAPPERDMSPPETDLSPSKGNVAPPKRIVAPPERDMSPSKGDIAPTKGIMELPSRDTILPKAPPPETVTDTNLETPSDTERQDQSVQKEEELPLVVPRPEGAGTESSTAPSRSPPVPKSCLKHKALASGGSPVEPPLKEPSPGVQDRAVVPPARTRPAQAATSGAPEKAALGKKTERNTEPQRSVKRFSVTSSRARARASSSRLLEHSGHVPAGGRAPLLRSGLAWKSEAALDDLQVLPEPQDKKAVGGDPQDSGDMGAGRAGPGRSLQDADPCASSVKEPALGGDQSPFPVKLRSTSLSLKYRDGSAQEAKAIKRYSAEVRLERGGLTVLPKDEQSHAGVAPALRSSRSPNGQGKGKSRSPEQPSTKPPLPRKPLLQSLTLQYPPAGLDASPGESERLIPVILPPEPRKEKSPHQGAEKGQPPAATGPGADGQPTPPWITMARQKRRGAPDLPVNQEDKPGPRILKTETGKQTQVLRENTDSVKQGDFVRSKSFLMTPVKPAVTQRQGSKLSPKEGLQRGISLSHQNLAAQAAAMTEKELHQLKRASYASTDQPSWMELARKKSQAWSDMPQIIK